MNLPLRWRLGLLFTLVLGVTFALLEVYLQTAVTRHGEEISQRQLLALARVTAQILPAAPWRPGPSLQDQVRSADVRGQARVTLIGGDGRVLADSQHTPATMENHADRPEVIAALADGQGVAARHSETLGVNMLYVAWRLPSSAGPQVLRLAQPLTAVDQISAELRQTLLGAFVLAALLAWGATLLLARRLTEPVQSLVRTARRVERGDLGARAEDVRSGELGELARVFNSALGRLEQLVETSQREGRHYAAILQQMSDAVIILDTAGRVQFVNPPLTRLFEVEPEHARGQYPEQIALNYELSALLSRCLSQQAVQRDEVHLLHPQTRTLACVVTPLSDEQGQPMGAIALLRDVTERRQVEEMRRDFVANASHELRTPAAGIKALAEALQMGALEDVAKAPRFLNQIVEAADRLTAILDDMLTLTRVERGQELLHPDWLPAQPALTEAADQVRPAAEAKGISLEVQAASEDRLYADSGGLLTILLNLTDNAVKYTPAGGRVTLTGQTVPGGYEVSVSDTGVGIPAEHQPRIFERFYRVDKARDRATGGTGLGLSIVKHTIEAHGGRVSVRSVPEAGSTFTVFFPQGNGGTTLLPAQPTP